MSFSSTPTSSSNNISYMGIQEQNPRETYIRRRDPTPQDFRGYKLGDRWINKSSSTAFILVSKTLGIAVWSPMGGSGAVTSLNTCVGAITISGAALGAIDVINACPAITIATRVDGVSIQVNGANNLEVIPAGILAALQFDPDVGINVSPVASIVQVPGIGGNRTLNGGAGILQFNNRRWLSAFTVDPSAVPGSDAEYTTIAAAILAAGVGPSVIYIRPGTYVENLVFQPNIDLIAVAGDGRIPSPMVSIVGNHSYVGNGPITFERINFSAPGGDVFSITPPIGVSSFLLFKECSVDAPIGNCIMSVPVAGASVTIGADSSFFTANASCFILNGGSQAILFDCDCASSGGPPNNAFILNDTSNVSVDDSTLSSNGDIFQINSATASAIVKYNEIFCGGAFIRFVAAGTARIFHNVINAGDASTNFIVGVGTVNYADLVNNGSAINIDPLTLATADDWKPYGTAGTLATAVRGTAGYDATQFTVTNGFVQLIGGSPIVTGTVQTVGAVSANVITYTLPVTSTVIHIACQIAALDSTGAPQAGAAYYVLAGIRTDGLATTKIGLEDVTGDEEAALAAADVSVNVALNDVQITVLGVAARTIDWKATMTIVTIP